MVHLISRRRTPAAAAARLPLFPARRGGRVPSAIAGTLAAGALVAAGLAAPATAAARAPGTRAAPASGSGDLQRVPLPFFWPNNYLYDVSAASPDSVWIAGTQGELVVPGSFPGTGKTIPGNPVVRRWKDGGWVEYEIGGLPSRGTITNVEAIAPEDVWIGGTRFGDSTASTRPYVARFTGSAFTEVALPAGTTAAGIKADAAGVWLWTSTNLYRRTGDTWTLVCALPQMEVSSWHARAADDIWALGRPSPYDQNIVAQHWDGRSWTSVPVQQPSAPGGTIVDVLPLSATDAWAVGVSYRTSPSTPLLLHWDGASWTSATPPAGLNSLAEVEPGPDGTLWAIGHALDQPAAPGLLRHRDGAWERVPATPVPNRSNVNVGALAVVPGTGHLWTTGSVNIGGPVVLSDR